MGITIGFRSSSLINGSDETLGCKSLSLSRVPLIEDGALRFLSPRSWRRSVVRSRPSDRELTPKMSPLVYRSLSSVFNHNCYNSSNERLRLNYFKINHCPIRVWCVPPHLSEDSWLRLSVQIKRFPSRHVTCEDIKKYSPTWQK